MLVTRLSAFLFLPILSCGFAFAASNPDLSRVMSNMPVRFEANAGQHNSNVKFTARTDGFSLFFTKRDVVFVPSGSSKAVTISLVNGAAAPVVEGIDPLPAKASYFTGKQRDQWTTGVNQYGRVRYSGVYSGVDLVYYGTGRQLEYDFILKPNADARQIRMKFSGADAVRMSADGDLLVRAGAQELKQKRPVAYQLGASGERQEVACHFRMAGRRAAGFELGSYDRSRELIIDPPLVYSTYVGGSSDDAITAMVTDRSGIIYMAGTTHSGDIAGTDNSFQGTPGGLTDIFVARINPTRTGAAAVTAFTYIGGDGNDIPTGLAIGPDGLLYLTGSTTSTNFPMTGNGVSAALSGTQDAFVVKIYPSLDGLIYSTYLGGTDVEAAYGIAVDSTGIYITGVTLSTDFPTSSNAVQSVTAGGHDAFITKLDINGGSIVYSTYLGGERTDEGRGIVIAPTGRVYVTGWTSSGGFPSVGNAYQAQSQGGGDIFIAGLDLSLGAGALVYSSYLGGGGDDEPRKLALDASGSLLLTGFTLSTNFPTTSGAYQPTQGGIGNAFVVKFDPRQSFVNSLQYSSYLGGASGEAGYDIVSDATGKIYVTGYTFSSTFPTTANALQPLYGGGANAFVTKLDPAIAGAPGLLYSTYLGGGSLTIGYGVSASNDGLIYVGGFTRERKLAVTDNSYQPSAPGVTGSSDGFVTVIDPSNQT
jgi:hypothetical protein